MDRFVASTLSSVFIKTSPEELFVVTVSSYAYSQQVTFSTFFSLMQFFKIS